MVTIRRNTQGGLLGNTLQLFEGLGDRIEFFLWLLLLRLLLLVRRGHVEDIVSDVELEVGARVNGLRAS